MITPMTVGELIELLRQYPPDLPCIYQCCSDWAALRAEDLKVVKGVPKSHWIMRVYESQIPTMSEENRQNIREFLEFPGN